MATFIAYCCDICNTQKGETNHWFRAVCLPGPTFILIPWSESHDQVAVKIEKHLCGLPCAVKFMCSVMEEDATKASVIARYREHLRIIKSAQGAMKS